VGEITEVMSAGVGDEAASPGSEKSEEEMMEQSHSASTGSKDIQAGNGLFHQSRRRGNGSGSSARSIGSNKSALLRAKLEGSRRSARECRARRKMRYQCLQDMVNSRERAILTLRRDLEMYKKLCVELDEGRIPKALMNALMAEKHTE